MDDDLLEELEGNGARAEERNVVDVIQTGARMLRGIRRPRTASPDEEGAAYVRMESTPRAVAEAAPPRGQMDPISDFLGGLFFSYRPPGTWASHVPPGQSSEIRGGGEGDEFVSMVLGEGGEESPSGGESPRLASALLAVEHQATHDLDGFFRGMYWYYLERGWATVLVSRVSSVLTLFFTIALSTLVFGFVNFGLLFACKDDGEHCATMEEVLSSGWESRGSGVRVFVVIYVVCMGCYGVWVSVGALNALRSAREWSEFYRERLQLDDDEVKTASWARIVEALDNAAKHNRLAVRFASPIVGTDPIDNEGYGRGRGDEPSTQPFGVHYVACRILRLENYIIAMSAAGELDLTLPNPFASWFIARGEQRIGSTSIASLRKSAAWEEDDGAIKEEEEEEEKDDAVVFSGGGDGGGATSKRIFSGGGGDGGGATSKRIFSGGGEDGGGATSKRIFSGGGGSDGGTTSKRIFSGGGEDGGGATSKRIFSGGGGDGGGATPPKTHTEETAPSKKHTEETAPSNKHTEETALPNKQSEASTSKLVEKEEDEGFLDRIEATEVADVGGHWVQAAVRNVEDGRDENQDREDEEAHVHAGTRLRIPWTKTLEWILREVVLAPLFDSRTMTLDGGAVSNAQVLRMRLVALGILAAVALPVGIVYAIVSFALAHAEEARATKEYLGPRAWTRRALWRFREVNELPHVFDRRIQASHMHAHRYLGQFPTPVLASGARSLVYMSGSLLALILALSLVDEAIPLHMTLGGRNLLWYVGILSAIVAVGRSIAPEPNAKPLDPRTAMHNLAAYTHHLPSRWKRQCHSYAVRDEVSRLYRPRANLFIEELCGAALAPVTLIWALAPRAEHLLNFVQQHTTRIEGLGDVCDLSAFRAKTADNPALQAKQQKSMLSFHAHHPRWSRSIAKDPLHNTIRQSVQQLQRMPTTKRPFGQGSLIFGDYDEHIEATNVTLAESVASVHYNKYL